MEKREQIEHLFNLYLSNQCTPAQVEQLAAWFNAGENEELLKSLIRQELDTDPPEEAEPPAASPEKLNELLSRIRKQIGDDENE